jgi:superfamily II DNA or RNA helicase
LRQAQVRDKLAFSRKYNQVVFGLGPPSSIKGEAAVDSFLHDNFVSQQCEVQKGRVGGLEASVSSATVPRIATFGSYAAVANRLKVQLRPFQHSALNLLMSAELQDTKLIQAPTGVGKDLIPFAVAVYTGKAQLVFVPYVPLTAMIVSEGLKYGCSVVKFTDVGCGKDVSLQTAAATADVIVCSYEHAPRAVRLAQELQQRDRLGWCFFNEAHVAVVDADYRDFGEIQTVAKFCPQVCCMTATLQPHFKSVLTSILGRPDFSRSIMISPERGSLKVVLKLTTDTRQWVLEDLLAQKHGRAIVFCLFKKSVQDMARILRAKIPNREVFECTSGATADLTAWFGGSKSTIMVATSLLATGVSIDDMTKIYFLDGAHGPEGLLQGAGRGARAEGETCVATLVTSKSQLLYLQDRDGYLGAMAKWVKACSDNNWDFGEELYRLFEHPKQCEDSMGSRLDTGQGWPSEDTKRRLFQSPSPKPYQQEEANVLCQSSEGGGNIQSFPPPVRKNVLCQFDVGQEQQSKRPCFQSQMLRQGPSSYSGLHQSLTYGNEHQGTVSEQPVISISSQGQAGYGFVSSQVQSQRHLPDVTGHNSRVPDYSSLARSILASRIILPLPDLFGRCEGWSCSETFCSMVTQAHIVSSGCGGRCPTKSVCSLLAAINDAACKNFHCQACFMPLRDVHGVRMHSSSPGCLIHYARTTTLSLHDIVSRIQILRVQKQGPDTQKSAGSFAWLANQGYAAFWISSDRSGCSSSLGF